MYKRQIAKTIDISPLSREDRAFATRLVLGVVSTRGTLEDIITGCMDSPDDAAPAVRDALCLSAYEIVFLQKSPHAAVDQGVEYAVRLGGIRAFQKNGLAVAHIYKSNC